MQSAEAGTSATAGRQCPAANAGKSCIPHPGTGNQGNKESVMPSRAKSVRVTQPRLLYTPGRLQARPKVRTRIGSGCLICVVPACLSCKLHISTLPTRAPIAARQSVVPFSGSVLGSLAVMDRLQASRLSGCQTPCTACHATRRVSRHQGSIGKVAMRPAPGAARPSFQARASAQGITRAPLATLCPP